MKVAIAGYGLEGEVNYRYWHSLGADITIFDESESPSRELPEGVKTVLGQGVFKKMQGFDLVIRTAGLNPAHIKTDGKIWSATNEFFANCPAPIIGVTGTKGKGTTCSLITEILKAAGKSVHLVGNIGVPALEVLPTIQPNDLVVFELSSFQLWDIEKSPETAIILMIAEDHLEVHADMNEYVTAKANIGIHQKSEDLMIYHPTNKLSAKTASKSPAKKIQFMTPEGAHLQRAENSQIADVIIDGHVVCSTDEVGLIGPHNLENVCAAVTAAWRYTQNIDAIRKGVTSFTGLPHRLEFVREIDGVKYYDDSQATGPDATIAAIRSFKQPELIIIGGSDKGASMTKLIDVLDPNKHTVLAIGASAGSFMAACLMHGFKNYIDGSHARTIRDIVALARENTQAGDVVLLSPAHASFDMFKSYIDRGDQFKATVKAL